MTRGTRLHLTREQVVVRAFAQLTAIPASPPGAPDDAGHRPVGYRLEAENGGDDPTAAGCWDWSYNDRAPTADCIGFALHCLGIDRMQPGYKGSRGEWLNCQSICDDAAGARRFFELVPWDQQLAADLLIDTGHVGVIVRRACSWTVGGRPVSCPPMVVDCSPRHGRAGATIGHAGIGVGGPWSSACRVVRLRGLV